MNEFFATSTSYPTIVFTLLLGVCLALGLLVLVGAIGPELFSIDADVDLDVGLDAADGAAEAGAEAAMEAAADGAAEAVADAASEGAVQASQGILGSLLAFIKPRNVPVLLAMSVWSLFGWVLTGILCSTVLASLSFAPLWAASTLLGAAGAVGSFVLTSIVLRPLGRAFKPEATVRREDIVGQTVTVDTSRVTRDFGSAKAADGGSGLVIPIRCDRENSLTRGSKALVVSYDPKREVYEVTSVQDIVPSEVKSASSS